MGHSPQIPLTPQTDERNFPRHSLNAPPGLSGHAFPKQLTRRFTKDDREAWLEKFRRIDQPTRQEYYEERVPKLGDPVPILSTPELVDAGFAVNVGEPVIVGDAEDEETVYEMLGIEPMVNPASVVAIPVQINHERENELEEENRKLRKLLAEKAPKVAATETQVAPKRKPGRPKKTDAVPRRLTLAEMAETE